MITGTYRWWWYNGEVKKGLMSAEDIYGHFQRMCWRIQAVAGPKLSIPYPQLETNTCSRVPSSCHRRSFPIASNSTREMPKKDRIHPFFQAWVGVSRTQRLRHGAAKSFRIQLPVTWSILGQNLTRDLAITINLKRTTRIFPIFVWLDSTFFSAIYRDLTLVAGRKQLASPWERSCRRPKP